MTHGSLGEKKSQSWGANHVGCSVLAFKISYVLLSTVGMELACTIQQIPPQYPQQGITGLKTQLRPEGICKLPPFWWREGHGSKNLGSINSYNTVMSPYTISNTSWQSQMRPSSPQAHNHPPSPPHLRQAQGLLHEPKADFKNIRISSSHWSLL